MMMTDTAIMRVIEYNRQKHHITAQRLCDDIGISKKDYDYYIKGIKTMHPPVFLEIIKYFGLEGF